LTDTFKDDAVEVRVVCLICGKRFKDPEIRSCSRCEGKVVCRTLWGEEVIPSEIRRYFNRYFRRTSRLYHNVKFQEVVVLD